MEPELKPSAGVTERRSNSTGRHAAEVPIRGARNSHAERRRRPSRCGMLIPMTVVIRMGRSVSGWPGCWAAARLAAWCWTRRAGRPVREGLSVLLHPETGDDLLDHTAHAVWLGTPLELRLDRL
jgi:hypothetical protein